MSNVLISLLGSIIPDKVRIPSHTGYRHLRYYGGNDYEGVLPDLYSALGLFISLIVVNCIIWQERSLSPIQYRGAGGAGRNKHGHSFTLALTLMGFVQSCWGRAITLGSLSLKIPL